MKPLKFQLETIKKIDKFEGRALIANDTGLGKTYTSLWWVEKTADALPLLVICPAIVKHQWASAIQQILKINPIVLESRKKRDTQKIQCAIINYDIVIDWLDVLLKQNFNTVILDECQMLTNPKAKRTKSSLKLAKQSKYCIALSATPVN
ncbi:MAG: hypothetical protein KatS3mg087_1213 [Patescibacteria group bacterium]|nr:MAG: hypothetical protein KatS3mg087_1213 [Patescibacteria group bacterium]